MHPLSCKACLCEAQLFALGPNAPRTGAVQAHFSCITNWTCFILLLRKTESCLKALTSMILSLALGSELVNSDRLTYPDTPPLIPV